jgi:DNA polymerase-3 subunit beta
MDTTKTDSQNSEVSVNAGQFKRALGLLPIERKNTLPVLGCALIEAEGGHIKITGYDLEVAATVDLGPIDPSVGWERLVYHRALKTFMKGTKAKQTVCLQPRGKHDLKISIPGSKSAALVGLPAADYPMIPTCGKDEFDCGELAPAAKAALDYVTADESRFAVPGALVKGGELVATDGHRLIRMDVSGMDAPETLLPREAIKLMGKVKSLDSGAHDEKHMCFYGQDKAGPISITSRKLEGTFPQYEKLIPQRRSAVIVPLDEAKRSEWIASMAGLPKSDRTHAVKVVINGAIELKTEDPDTGSGSARLSFRAENHPDEVTIAFNAQYLEAALKLPLEGVQIKDAETQVLLYGQGVDVVVMPMRT